MLNLTRQQPAFQQRSARCFARPVRQHQHRTSVRSGVSGKGSAMVIISAVAGAGLKAFVDHYMTTNKKVEELRKTTDDKVNELCGQYHTLDKETSVTLKGVEAQLVSISNQLQQQGSQLQSLLTDIPNIYKLLEQLPNIAKQLNELQHPGHAQLASP